MSDVDIDKVIAIEKRVGAAKRWPPIATLSPAEQVRFASEVNLAAGTISDWVRDLVEQAEATEARFKGDHARCWREEIGPVLDRNRDSWDREAGDYLNAVDEAAALNG